jgi:RNA polymerase sigma factor (sigma-70 family)
MSMDARNGEESVPSSTDLNGWCRAVADGRFRDFKMEDIIAAIQDLGPACDKGVLNPLVLHVSDAIMRILRSRVSRNYRNEGEDIITRAHGQLVTAMLNRESADGRGMRFAFVPRVQFRAADAIRAEQKNENRERTSESAQVQIGDRPPQELDPRQELDERIDLERILSHVTDERKRLAFRLYMEDYPLESNRSASISMALGVSAKTAGQWIEEVRAQLRDVVGEKS